ncbi:PQQ-binding-like beta-propeller repeat protein [Phenylobacterium sp. LjRoot219]|uniref:outer membrane protein assembly factor BamB family protein n=1 Tax=Phenylobacterium sp. LjRoot219 TaxID=3342283 RepID=UPI003ECF379A
MGWNWRMAGCVLGLGFALAGGAIAVAADVASMLNADPREAPDPRRVQRGAEIYIERCGSCHDAGVNRAPSKVMLSMVAPRSIEATLSQGVMKAMAEGLSDEDKRSVAEYIAQKRLQAAPPSPRMCAAGASPFDLNEPPPLAGWGFAPGSVHAIPPETAGLTPAAAPSLKLKWALAFPNALRARSQPTLGGGAILVGSHDGSVFAIDRATGCTRWVFQAAAEVRSGVTLTPWTAGDAKARPLLTFGDLLGNVYALDARTGAQVWRIKADPHPNATITGTPALFEGKLLVPVSSLEEASAADARYPCCSFRGSLIAFDVKTGARLWQTFTVDRPAVEQGVNPAGAARFTPSGAAIWSAPTVDARRRRVYVATGDNYTQPATAYSDAILALDVDSGRIVWANQVTEGDAWNVSCMVPDRHNCPDDAGPDHDFGAPPVLAEAADGQPFLLAGQKSGVVYGLDPDTGKLRWKTKVGRGGAAGGVNFGMSAQDGRVFVPITDYGPPADEAKPGLYALDIKTGRVLWRFQSTACEGQPAGCLSGFGGVPTAVGRLVLVGGDDGRLRALAADSGALIWESDTATRLTTVNGETGQGGAIAGGLGPIAYQGMVVVPSGHGFTGKKPGNLLMVFAAE